MQSRDERILKHIALYRVSIRAVIEHLFFDGKSCDDVINRMVAKDNLLTVHKLPNGISYYRLSLSAARARGVQENRARSQGVQARALRRTLAMLWFCCMGEKLRHRIERNLLTKLFKDAPGLGIPHCWEAVGEAEKRIYRVYTPGPNTGSDEIVRTLRADGGDALAHAELAPHVLSKRYMFVVLLEHPDRVAHLAEQLKRTASIPVHVELELVPSVHDLASAIRVHKSTRRAIDGPLS